MLSEDEQWAKLRMIVELANEVWVTLASASGEPWGLREMTASPLAYREKGRNA